MSGTILLADDSLTIQKVVELTFAETDYRVIAVSSGDELLDRLADSRPDLIICDVIMPGKDGYEVCQQIKSSSAWLHLPVILLTGTFEPFDRDRAIAAGCSEIITKPFEARKLVDTVERLIGGPNIQPAPTTSPAAVDEGEDWPEDATPTDFPTAAEPEEFGTQLSAPKAEDDSIEFTTSGFAEMEAAGRPPQDASDAAVVDEGIDYELTGSEERASEGSSSPPATDPSAQTIRIDISSLADEAESDDDKPSFETPADDQVPASVAVDPSQFSPVATDDAAPEPFEAADDEPFETPPEATTDEVVKSEFEDEPSMADTSPVELPSDHEESNDDDSGDGAFKLTDDDIDRIARRVIELASDRLEQIAWEIVPDMAEVVVRQRIRELEAESEATSPDTVQ
jgi:CheY-like chemotaxis protein